MPERLLNFLEGLRSSDIEVSPRGEMGFYVIDREALISALKSSRDRSMAIGAASHKTTCDLCAQLVTQTTTGTDTYHRPKNPTDRPAFELRDVGECVVLRMPGSPTRLVTYVSNLLNKKLAVVNSSAFYDELAAEAVQILDTLISTKELVCVDGEWVFNPREETESVQAE